MRLGKLWTMSKWRICVPSVIIILNILSCLVVSGNLLPPTPLNIIGDNDEFNFPTTTTTARSVSLNTTMTSRGNEGFETQSVQNVEEGKKPTGIVLKNVGDKVRTDDMMRVTDSDPQVKELVREEDPRSEPSSRRVTFATELYNAVERVDGAATVNQSTVSESVTKSKTETETSKSSSNSTSSRGEEESSTLLVLRLAQCRANCLTKKTEKLKKRHKYTLYFKKLDVFGSTLKEQIKSSYSECWNTCLLLEIENGENHPAKLVDVVCSLNNITCLSGCQEACEFHHVQHVAKNGTKAPLLAAKVESFLSYNLSTPSTRKRGGFQLDLRWPSSPESEGSLVYSVVQHVRMLKNGRLAWTWRLLEQTTVGRISLSFSDKPKIGDIRVLAANPHSLVHVFSQEKVGRASGKIRVVKNQQQEARDHPETEQHPPPFLIRDPQDPWHLRKVSMVHQKFLVVTEITWDLPQNKSQTLSSSSSPPPPKQGNETRVKETSDIRQTVSPPPPPTQIKCNFLLTWEVSGGILRGNMVTDSNTVTISLWPDTIYSIQVGLIDEDSSGSGDKKPLKPWEFEGEPKVTRKSALLSVNTSDAVYGDQTELTGVTSNGANSEEREQNSHQHRQAESVELISSFAQIQPETGVGAAGDGVNDNDDRIRNSTRPITGWKCDSPSGASKWLCQLSISWLVILGSIYGLLFILSMTVYLFFAFKNHPYPSPRRFSSYLRTSTCKLALLHDDFQQSQAEEEDSNLPHFDHDRTRKELDTLSQYNIV